MSRIGKLPIDIPEGVEINIQDNNVVTASGKMGELSKKIDPALSIKQEDNQLIIERPTNSKKHKSLHGLYRSLLYNLVTGVAEGFERKLILKGVGYRAEVKGQVLELGIGYSHPLVFQFPDEIQVDAYTERRSDPVVTIRGMDKQLVGQVAAKIRSYRPPEPYKGKGILYSGEEVRIKAGKSAASA